MTPFSGVGLQRSGGGVGREADISEGPSHKVGPQGTAEFVVEDEGDRESQRGQSGSSIADFCQLLSCCSRGYGESKCRAQ